MPAVIQIRINSTSAGNGLAEATNQIRDLGGAADKADGPLRGMLDAAKGLAGLTFGALTAGTAALAGFAAAGIAMNASAEQTEAAFGTLLGSGELAAEFLGDLRDFAATTPFEFPELADSSKKLLAMGFNAKDVIPMMTDIGDAVGALGGGQAEIDRVTMALGQMRAKGKVSAEEMMQLAELGIPAWQFLADAMGISTAEAMKLSEKGLIPADTAIAALREGMQETFGGAMATQATTFNGLMSTLKDNASMALMAFTGPLFEMAKSALTALGTLVSSPAFQAFATTMGEHLAAAMQGLLVVLQPVGAAVSGFIQALASGQDPLAYLIGQFQALDPAVQFAGVALAAIGAAIAVLASPIVLVTAIVAALAAAWATNFGNIQGVTQTVMTAVQGVITSVMGVVLAFWQQNGAQIMAFVQTTWAQIQTIIGLALEVISIVVSGVLAAVSGFIDAHGTEIIALLTTAWNQISLIIETALTLIQDTLGVVLALIEGDFGGAWDAIQELSVAFVRNLVRLIEGGATLLGQAVDLGIAAITDAWTELNRRAPEIGKSFIGGVISGIGSMVSGLVEAAKRAARAAVDAMVSLLKIGSPSKVTAMEIGMPIAQGMAQGITAGAPMVAAAAANTAGAAVAGGQSAVNRTTTNNYTLNSYSNARASTVQSDFNLMRTLAGVA